MSALDLDALERLTRAYADAHAAMLADDRSAQAWLDDEAASKALATHYGGQWASPAQCVDVLALITHLRATESERDDLRCEVEALQAERDTARLEAGRLRARLRAAEARPAWQPIASVPIGETVMLWTPVRRIHVGHVTTLAWCEYTAWAPLPAAPEAP